MTTIVITGAEKSAKHNGVSIAPPVAPSAGFPSVERVITQQFKDDNVEEHQLNKGVQFDVQHKRVKR